MNNLEHLENIRVHELNCVLPYFNPPGKVLELGAGSGWQAKKIEALGNTVSAIDLKESSYANDRIFPVIDYNGKDIPFDDNTFDYVFSSNVLEHVSHIDEMNTEIKRVLKKDGIAVHILPSSSWRIWTTLTHYIWLAKKVSLTALSLAYKPTGKDTPVNDGSHTPPQQNAVSIRRVLLPNLHGERGNVVSEIYYFSRAYWKKAFTRSGFTIKEISETKLVYTGNSTLDHKLPISTRRALSGILGSSCNIFVLKNDKR